MLGLCLAAEISSLTDPVGLSRVFQHEEDAPDRVAPVGPLAEVAHRHCARNIIPQVGEAGWTWS